MHIVKDHDERRNEFLDTALRLFMEKGYEETSVNAIIDAVGVSKGAFYHYFRTKEELLDHLAERAAVQALAVIEPVAADPRLTALEKLNQVFARSNALKARNRELLVTLLRVLYSDRNILLRNRVLERNIGRVAPVLAGIFEQGNREGVFSVRHPLQTAGFILRIGGLLSEEMARVFPAGGPEDRQADEIFSLLDLYTDSVERILQAPTGSIRLVDESIVGIIRGKDGKADT